MGFESPSVRAQAARDLLQAVARDHGPAVFACSFGAEDMVLVDLIARAALPIAIVTLDTGRLPAETHELIGRVEARYSIAIEVESPDPSAVAAYVTRHGRDAFYDSIALREQCCAIRKMEPLSRALHGKRAWITGLRKSQGTTRRGIAIRETDARYGVLKFNPLAEWSEDDVWAHIRAHAVPYNELHDRGYPSIGCAPCTRAVEPGEDARAGRWWWESAEHKECGLHRRPQTVAVTSIGRASST